jgi:hypothetical protein
VEEIKSEGRTFGDGVMLRRNRVTVIVPLVATRRVSTWKTEVKHEEIGTFGKALRRFGPVRRKFEPLRYVVN